MGNNGARVHRGRARQNITREKIHTFRVTLSGVHREQVENTSSQSQARVYERKK